MEKKIEEAVVDLLDARTKKIVDESKAKSDENSSEKVTDQVAELKSQLAKRDEEYNALKEQQKKLREQQVVGLVNTFQKEYNISQEVYDKGVTDNKVTIEGLSKLGDKEILIYLKGIYFEDITKQQKPVEKQVEKPAVTHDITNDAGASTGSADEEKDRLIRAKYESVMGKVSDEEWKKYNLILKSKSSEFKPD